MDLTKSCVILLVEDDPGDQKLIKSALTSQTMPIDLHVVPCAEDALRYLKIDENGTTEDSWPDLILLDLNMPGMGGKEFLMYLKASEHLCVIPVVVLTTSGSEADVDECYGLHAAGYIQKPGNPGELRDIMNNMLMYWFDNCIRVKGLPLAKIA